MSAPLPSSRPSGGVRELLSPKQVAAAAGVSESTVKRLVDDGSLPAERTAGGHRRIRLRDALAWVRSRGCGRLNPAALAAAVPALEGAGGVDLCDPAAVRRRYAEALEAGEEAVTTGLAVALFVAGAELAEVLEDPIRGRYAGLRGRCDHPSRECLVLHRALANSVAAAGRLRDFVCESPRAEPSPGAGPSAGGAAPAVVTADVGYEVDALPVHLAAALAAALGCRATNLGACVPAAVLGGTLERLKPRFLWLSAGGGTRVDAARVAAACAEAAAGCRAVGAALLTHGDAIPAGFAPDDADVRRVDSLPQFADLLTA